MLEIEIKAYCDNHTEVLRRLKSLGGAFQEKILEHDVYYNHPCRDFAQTDEALRTRSIDKKSFLTYKGPKLDRMTKTRVEREVEFRDVETVMCILAELGFTTVDTVDKERVVYLLNDITVCLDTVYELGTFVELEKLGDDKENIERELFDWASKLGLSRFETRSYLELKLLAR